MIDSSLAALLMWGQTEIPDLAGAWQLRWHWSLPGWLTVLGGVAAVSWVSMVYLRENSTAGRRVRVGLATLRAISVLLLFFMLAQPTLEWLRFENSRVIVLVDRSSSMRTIDQYKGAPSKVSRIESLQQLIGDGEQGMLARWRELYAVDVVAFDTAVTPIDALDDPLEINASTADGTRLGDAIDFALRELPGTPPVAIVVMTDGNLTAGIELERAAQQARRMRVPLHTVAIGSERRPPDIAIENLIVEEVVFPGDRLQIDATIRATGVAGQSIAVNLNDDQGQTLTSTTVRIAADEATRRVSISFRPDEPGELTLELRAEPLLDEADTENNRVTQVIDVRDEKIRVLLVDSQPSYEYRALKSLLERDPAVRLSTLLQEADADFVDVDDTAVTRFPLGDSEWTDYDVLILGDVDLGLLPRSAWSQVERFVTQYGGGMVAVAGPRFMPSAFRTVPSMTTLLPIELESINPLRSQPGEKDTFAVYPTSFGWQSPSLQLGDTREDSERVWHALPRLTWALRLDDLKPGTLVLAECPEWTNRQGRPLPIAVRQYVGAGEVLFHATDETWRWRYRTDDRYFARYWGQVVRRLGRGRLAAGRAGVSLSADRSTYEPGEQVGFQARFRNPAEAPAAENGVVVLLQGTYGPARELTLTRRLGRRGIYATNIDDLPPDSYEARILQPTGTSNDNDRTAQTHFEVRQPPQEVATVAVNRKALRAAAEVSGGKFYAMPDVAGLSDELPPPRQQYLVDRPPRQIWNSHAVIALFITVLTSEWWLRRRYGML